MNGLRTMSSLSFTQSTPDTVARLSGRTLVVARSLWFVVFAAATVAFVFAVPFRWAMWAHPSPTNLANLNALGIPPAFVASYVVFWEMLTAAPYLIVGLIIFRRCGEERIALLASLFLVVFGVGSGTLTPTMRALLGVHPALDLLQHSFEFISWLSFGLFFYPFPNGRFVPAWTRWLAAIWLPICIVWNYASDSPFAPLNWSMWLFVPVIGGFWASWLYSQVYRYRRVSNAVERQQTKWVVFSVSIIILTMLAVSAIGAFVPGYDLMSEEQPTPASFAYMFIQWPLSLVIASLPIAIAFSILRYRLWEIDNLISRALVYGALTAFVIATYVLVVGGLGALFQSSGNLLISLIATGSIALLFNPLRERLQRLVNRLIYGERDDPYAVLSRLGKSLEATLAPDAVLSTIVETIAQTLKLPYAAIILRDADTVQVASVFGSPTPRALALPLMYQHQLVGELHVAPRSPDEPFTSAERRLLEDIAAQIGVAVHNVRLTADLQHSRQQLVGAREEERRRLRRDLHDGLGPKLAGQTLKLEAALDSLDGETETARALLQETMSESQTVITEIRRLVYGLRPPALDQLGLLSAIREQATHYQLNGLQVTVSAPDTMPTLPAAVEVAAYRIIQEA
ncbi:MAG: GAF domain-containing protein, partial [Chloroflexota bacterium]|nr:GAF domain-containing protein [Chloroflexota bacterium]